MSAFSGGLELQRGDGQPTETFTKIPGMTGISGLGQSNPNIDVTDWDSVAKEFIAGLPEGQEVTLELNRKLNEAEQEGIISDVENGVTRNFRLIMNNGTVVETFDFSLAMQSWDIAPSFEDKHTMSATGKLSGAIGRATV